MRGKAALLSVLVLAAPSAWATAFTVTNLSDGAAPGPAGSLRKAISDSNATTGPNTISFSAFGGITLTAGQLEISKSVTISAPPGVVIIDGGSASRIFQVDGTATVTLFGLILLHGSASGSGGAILNAGSLTVSRCIVANSTSSANGGGIDNVGTLIVVDTSIVQNQAASGLGGGIHAQTTTTTTIAASTLAGNTAARGGGLSAQSANETLLTNVTVALNTSTLADTAAVDVPGKLRFESCTVSQNTSSGSGSSAVRASLSSAVVKLHNTIVAGNVVTAGQLGSIAGATLTSLGHNISSDGTGNLVAAGDLPSTDPKLGTLAPNGSATNSFSLLHGSPAIDAGDNTGAPSTDQRGRPRPAAGTCSAPTTVDIGSFEVQSYSVTSTSDSGAGTLRQAVLDNNTYGGGVACLSATGMAFVFSVLDVGKNLDIQGQGQLTLDGNNSPRIFHIASGATVRIEGVLLTRGGGSGGDGGAILNEGNLTLRYVDISNCDPSSFSAKGGAIASSGTLTIDRCRFAGNNAVFGGAIATSGSGTTSISASSFLINFAADGSALYLESSGPTDLTNVTLTENQAQNSAGTALDAVGTGPVSLESCTIADSVNPGSGAGVRAASGASVSYRNTIVAGNDGTQFAGSGTLMSLGHNISSDATGNLTAAGDKPSTDPLLAPSSPGYTFLNVRLDVHAPRLGSPAIDAGDPAHFPNTDERGLFRPALADCGGSALPDIGAFEVVREAVLNTLDSGEHSLRQVIAENDSSGGGNVICFALAPYPKTITLTSGNIVANQTVGIMGPGAGLLTLSGNGTNRVLDARTSADVTGLTIANGNASVGGGITSDGALTATSVVFTGNTASTGGAIAVTFGFHPALTVERCLFTGNTASSGAAIHFAVSSTKALVRNSTFSGNTALGASGGVIEAANSTTAIRLEACTVTANGANGSGDSAAVVASISGARVEYLDTIVAGNTASGNNNHQFDAVSGGVLASLGHNISSDATGNLTGTGDKPSTNPKLGALADHGGPTKTYPLLSGSPALDAGDPSGCGTTLKADQRGFPRPAGAACDIGAFERDLAGDVNASGQVDVIDVFYLINYLFAGGPPPKRDPNVNGDTAVSVADVFYLINYIFAGGPPPV